MPELSTWALFMVAAMALLVTPGPAVLYIVARSINQGRVAGLVSVLGVGVGTLFHVGAAALGLSALLVSSALAFSVVKYLGAAYLIFLGLSRLFSRRAVGEPLKIERKGLARIFYQGVIVNVLNPKTALFFFAFLPQFVDPSRGAVALQVMVFGVTFVVLGIFSDGLYAMLAGSIGHWLKGNKGFARVERYLVGTVYIGLGVATALSGPGTSKNK